ncbi:cytosine/adenosine deaminase-related metal-dependent hydrolase [Kitasatospora sp. MAP12-15]|uniref:amidohydrolase family protein n=1 Tax=unclassified Kitasatospora TaxID=2633591 RepID=UPI0024771A1B|nr:hypothetical protein [Kitasatospora sp. MAP12-44]MDH6112358.1 cytosine/adenosine deaminase-related metal-dependent hydrolase [Kitasatospora sp. MAP12-44]
MLTLHRAGTLLVSATAPPIDDGAVLVRGDVVAEAGPYAQLLAAHPGARVRAWEGVLTPGRANPHGRLLLEACYHPDPREELGEEPLAPPRALTDAEWGASARRGLQRMLGRGTTAVAGPFERTAVRTAVSRSGLLVLPLGLTEVGAFVTGIDLSEQGRAALADTVPYGALTPGARADFTVLTPADQACEATVLAGRLVYRRR